MLILIMKIAILNKKNKHNKHKTIQDSQEYINNIREKRFNNRYKLTELNEQYDGLGDPHTSYYFSNQSVKSHLKSFKKAIQQQKNCQQRARIRTLISLRIKDKYQQFLFPNSSNFNRKTYKQWQSKQKKSIFNLSNYYDKIQLKPVHIGFINKTNKNFQQSTTRSNQMKYTLNATKSNLNECINEDKSNKTSDRVVFQRKQKKLSNQQAYANKLTQQLHIKKRNKWINFLQEKKKIISDKSKDTESHSIFLNSNPEQNINNNKIF